MDDVVQMKAPVDTTPNRRLVGRLAGFFPILLLASLCIVFALLSDRFISVNNGLIILQQSTVLLVAALAMTFVVVNGSIDLSVGSTVALSALAAAAASAHMGAYAIIPALAVGFVCGLLNGVLFAYGKIPSFIVTLGTLVIYRGIVLLFTKGAPVSISDPGFLHAYATRTWGIPNSVVIAAVALLMAAVVFNHTVFGREVRAVGGGERVALLSGIPVNRVKLGVFVLCGSLCGLAGLLQSARTMAATAQLAQGLELDVIAAVVVGGTPLTGGIGQMRGTLLGVMIIAILSNGMNMIGMDPYMQNIIKGAVLIGAVFLTIDRTKILIIK
ncbi:ABC transporter permease [Phyllobacterium endophyticum]|uniref:Sugar ABC transporter permease n=1 Tax=Phyllobacterium endophyticum TaxID=1149773 RepID=A0A2P7AR89_9HYPH|nr:ABC transporter permease [Phyllobacterium endophyticum]MBB3237295.1 ribose/xylose/arabinose/galactoside ABC-type transport system permease subunit [Phyllobacterium endophyticum]PSH56663.1 sugar ABC transporter permease [Phyllobacterium endophyticum]TYR44344.1 ABC transporter permease [Phyllobacterium endophyticum]